MNKQTRSELVFVFSQMYEKHLKLVPKEILLEVEKEKDLKVYDSFDKYKPFTKQDLSEETLEILSKIFKDIPDLYF